MPSIKFESGKSKTARGRLANYWYSLGDVSGAGETKEAAFQQFEERVRRSCTHESTEVFVYAGFVAVISRDLHGWSYKVVRPETKDGPVYSSVSCSEKKNAHESVRWMIAQNLYPDPRCYGVIEDERKKEDFASWVRFQERYKECRDQGMSDAEAHQKACGR